MSRRTVLLIVALVIAALGAFLVWRYVAGVENSIKEGLEPVDVLVATQQIPAGTSGSAAQAAGAFELRTLTREAVAPGALSSADPIAQLVALAPVFPGQQILNQMWGAPSNSATAAIPEGKIAVSLQLGDPQRVAAFVQPGSNVVVFFTGTNAGEATAFSRVLIPSVQVIATGNVTTVTQTTTTADGTQTETQLPVALLTLAVDQAQAQQIRLAETQGQLSFGMLTDQSPPINARAVTTPGNLFR